MDKGPESPMESPLLDKSLAFFGAITASVSHELNNVLSILNQTGGLLGDLLSAAKEGKSLSNERLERIAQTLKAQTERGIGIVKRLNTFSHSADVPRRTYDLNQVVENLVGLTQRLASLKKAGLTFFPAGAPLVIEGNPFMAQQAVFWAIRTALAGAKDNDTLALEIDTDEEGAKLTIRGIRDYPENDADRAYLDILVHHLGGKAGYSRDGGHVVCEIAIPPGG